MDDLINVLVKQLELIIQHPYWLPTEKAVISFYSNNLKFCLKDHNNYESALLHARNLVRVLRFIIPDDFSESEGLPDLTNVDVSHIGEKLDYESDELYSIYVDIFERNTKRVDALKSAPENYYNGVDFEEYQEDICVGFDGEASHLLDRLASSSMKKLEVMSLVGMGGLGKTTLARRLYNDPLIVYHFYVRGWVSFSQVYRKREILLDILISVIELTDEVYSMDVYVLAHVLFRALKGRKYLIVIDDLWNIEDWEDIKRSFPNDNNGSKILVTMRLNEAALHAQSNGYPHFLRFLNEDESFDLFRKKAVLMNNFPHRMTDIGKEITRKCGGLPLAIVVVAGLLRTSTDSNWWKQIAEGLSSYIANDENHLMDTLALSYDHLPYQLRSCFLYFGAFPEDTDIHVVGP